MVKHDLFDFSIRLCPKFCFREKKVWINIPFTCPSENLDTLFPRIFPKSACLKIFAKRKALSLGGSYYFPVWIPLKFKRKKLAAVETGFLCIDFLLFKKVMLE